MLCPKCGWNLVVKIDKESGQRLSFCPNGQCGDYEKIEDYGGETDGNSIKS